MGYYVRLTEANAVLPAGNFDEAYKRLCDLNSHDEWKKGGSSTGAKWFSWMDENYPEVCQTAEQILRAVGYDIAVLEDGSLAICDYDNKNGCEDVFIYAIADLLKAGYMLWRGEDGAHWRWTFGDGKPMMAANGQVTWDNAEEFQPTNWPELYASWGLRP